MKRGKKFKYGIYKYPLHFNLFEDDILKELEVTKKDKVVLYHFGRPNLTYLDPDKWGEQGYTPKNSPERDVVYFYTNPKDKEKVVSGTLYKTKVPLKDLYPFDDDPLELKEKAEVKNDFQILTRGVKWAFIVPMLKEMGYKGVIYSADTGYYNAAIWQKITVEEAEKQEKEEIGIPKTDRIGWPIKDGLSTDPKLETKEEKVRRVIASMLKSYDEEDIIKYIQSMDMDIEPNDVEVYEKIVLKPGEDGWDKYIKLVAQAYMEAPEFEQSEVWRWESLKNSNYTWWRRLLSKVEVIFVSSNDQYKDGPGRLNIFDKEYTIQYLEGGQPYSTQEEMKKDYVENNRLYVSSDYSEHPVLTFIDNIVFRTVHDFIVHILADVDFTGLGEIKAYNAHAKLLPPDARPAAFTEVVGQAACFLTHGEFPVQKITTIPGFDYLEVGKVDGYDVVNKELVKVDESLEFLNEGFSQGHEIYLIMDKDRKYFVARTYHGTALYEMDLYSIDTLNIFDKNYAKFDTEEAAQKELDTFKKADMSIGEKYDFEITNFTIRFDPWEYHNGNKYFQEHDVISLMSREEAEEWIRSGESDNPRPDYPQSHQRSNDPEYWANYHFPCYNMNWNDDYVKSQNDKMNIIKDENKYNQIMNSLEVVTVFIGAQETEDLGL